MSVKAKTRAAFESLGGHVVVQDSGFAIEALNGCEGSEFIDAEKRNRHFQVFWIDVDFVMI